MNRTTSPYILRAAVDTDSTRAVNEATGRLYNAAALILTVTDSHGSTSGWEFSPQQVQPYAAVGFRATSDEEAVAFARRILAGAGHTAAWSLSTGLGIHRRDVA